jgi:2',3'-cyclic-nucleotide 2'-phosphodiesterase (5'-nucleotidase family)
MWRSSNTVTFNRFFLFLLLAILPVLSFHSCQPETSRSTIVIFHVNDVHGAIDNFAKIGWLLEEERKQNPNVFFMSAGDNFTGNCYVDNSEPTKGAPILTLFNRLGLNAQVLGNHDFDYGQKALRRYIEGATFPVICANIIVAGAMLPQPGPYITLATDDGVRIAVMGAVQTGRYSGKPSTHPANVGGILFSDGIESMLAYKSLRNNYDVLIGLTHLGFSTDEKLAGQMGELDVIIGGHSHTKVETQVKENGVLIAQAGDYGRYVGRIDLVVEDGVVVEKRSSLINAASIQGELSDVKAMIDGYQDNQAMNQTLTTLSSPLEGKDELGCLITDGVRSTSALDIVFQNNGGIRVWQLPQDSGNQVSVCDVYEMLPFGNEVVALIMSPAEIRSLIANSFIRANGIDLQVSGIEYTVNYSEDTASSVKVNSIDIVTPDGNPLDESKTYWVGLNSYIYATYEFAHQDPGRSTYKTMAEILVDYIGKGVDAQQYKGIKRARAKLAN